MLNNGNCWYSDVLIVKKILWALVSSAWLAFGREKSKLKVIILHSKPNLTALFERQSRHCWHCWKLLLKISAPSGISDTQMPYRWEAFVGNSLLRWAGLGIRTGETLKALQAKFDDRGKVPEAVYSKFPLRSIIKINKRQLALHTNGTIVQWMVELLKYYISEYNISIEATVAFVKKVSIKKHCGLTSL